MNPEKLFLTSLIFAILNFDMLCFSRDTLSTNQNIKGGEVLVSKNKNFALGFFSPGSSKNRYLGIWFHQVSKQSVVWVANRNKPITGVSGGLLKLNQHGTLIIYDNDQYQELQIWSTNVSVDHVTPDCVAQLLDSGNLVVSCDTDGSGRRQTLWQSFDYPTNTVLSGMKIGLNRKAGHYWAMNSWKSADDPGIGDYWMNISLNGSPQIFLYNSSKPYWRKMLLPQNYSHLGFNYRFVNNEEEVYAMRYLPVESATFWVLLDESGNFRALSWHESEGKWSEMWSLPKLCELFGWCGSYGMCETVSPISSLCTCLPGYEPRSPKEWFLGNGSRECIRKREQSSSICGHGEGFVEVAKVKLPDTSEAIWVSSNMSRDECEGECLRKCSCSAYAFRGQNGTQSTCWAWYGELKDIVSFQALGDSLYVRVDAQELAEIARKSDRNGGSWTVLLASIASAWFGVTLVFMYSWCRKRKKRAKKRLLNALGVLETTRDTTTPSSPQLKYFSLTKVQAATNNFSMMCKIGQGGFGTVYKGCLPNGQEVAIKRLSKDSGQGIEEFKNELVLIAKLQHKNLVKLLGCCIERNEKMLVYEYLPNKSLDLFLFDNNKRALLNWKDRCAIIIGIARGILYLHQDSRLKVIHRDLKTSNILLDSDMNPKISDFGMARIFRGDQVQDNTQKVVGTFGYMPPEYVVRGRYSEKSDVFSFGVILLEIITGKKNNRFCNEDQSLTLIEHVWEFWSEGRALETVDSYVKEACDTHEVSRYLQVGLLCVQEDPMDRPAMPQVLVMLSSQAHIPCPNHPAYIQKLSSKGLGVLIEPTRSCSINEMTFTNDLTR